MRKFLARLFMLVLVLYAGTLKAQEPCKDDRTWTPYTPQEPCRSIRVPKCIVVGFDVVGPDTVWHTLAIGPMESRKYKSRFRMHVGTNTCKPARTQYNLEPCK